MCNAWVSKAKACGKGKLKKKHRQKMDFEHVKHDGEAKKKVENSIFLIDNLRVIIFVKEKIK